MGDVVVEARPAEFRFDPRRTAVIVVDMQNDFGSEGGMFHRAGLDIAGIRSTIGPTARLLAAARSAGVAVVYLQMGYHPDLSDLGPDTAPNRDRHLRLGVGEPVHAPDGTHGRVLVRDTWNTAIVPELVPGPDDVTLYKHRFSGFFETELHQELQRRGIRDLVFAGCTTSVCVESTVRDAMFRDYRCLVLEDCTAEPIGDGLSRTNHEASLLVIETLFGWVAGSGPLVDQLTRSTTETAAVT